MTREIEKQLNTLIALLRNAQLDAADTSDEEIIRTFIDDCLAFQSKWRKRK